MLHILSPSTETFWSHDVMGLAGPQAARSNGAVLQYFKFTPYVY